MAQIQITSTIFTSLPYDVYVCDVYGNQCVLVANIVTLQPPTIVINVPIQFNNAPAIGIKIIDSLGCEIFKILDCSPDGLDQKQFQDGYFFYFMDNDSYDFQN